MAKLTESEPSTYEKVVEQRVRKNEMMEEYQSVMKIDVWEIVTRLEVKYFVTSKWNNVNFEMVTNTITYFVEIAKK